MFAHSCSITCLLQVLCSFHQLALEITLDPALGLKQNTINDANADLDCIYYKQELYSGNALLIGTVSHNLLASFIVFHATCLWTV